MAGSAAIMDICSTIAAVGGAMTIAGGPPGAIVGALFSVISMVLKMFVKEQQSLTTQVHKMLLDLGSRKELADLEVAQKAIDAFALTLMPKNGKTLDLTRNKWTLENLQSMLNPIEGNTIVQIRAAAVWLERDDSQQLSLWGEILAAQCQVYINYMFSLTVAVTSLDVSATPDGGAVIKEKLLRAFTSNNPAQLEFLRRIQPMAQRRGIVWSIGRQNVGQWADTGPLLVRDTTNGPLTTLGHEQRVVAVAKRKSAQANSSHPYFAIFSAQRKDTTSRSPGPAFRNQQKARMFFLEGKWPLSGSNKWEEVKDIHGVYDIVATPGEKDREVYLYVADGSSIVRYSNEGGPTLQDRTTRLTNWKGYTVDSVAVAPKPLIAEGDRSNTSMGEAAAIYGAGDDTQKLRFIRVAFDNAYSTLPAPRVGSGYMQFAGIVADRKRLWIFSQNVIACVTHTDAKRYTVEAGRNRNRLAMVKQPEWAVHTLPEEVGSTSKNYDVFSGLHDLAPSEDGSLLASLSTKKEPELRTYIATPVFDHKGGNLIIKGVTYDKSGKKVETHGWTPFDEKGKECRANRIYKQQIFCWPLLDRLMTLLEERPAESQTQPKLIYPPIQLPPEMIAARNAQLGL